MVLCLSRNLSVALGPRLPHAFPCSWFINSLCAHVAFERSTDEEWHNLSGTSSDGWGRSLEQVARVPATQRQEKLSVNNLQLFIETLWCNNNISNIFIERNCHFIIQTAYTSLGFIEAQETDRQTKLARMYEQSHTPPSVAAPKSSVINSTRL